MSTALDQPTSTSGDSGSSSAPRAKGRARDKQPKAATVVLRMPQVNLLPPEVRAARSLGILKRWLAVALVLVLVAIGGAYLLASSANQSADAELADAQDATTRLKAAEAKYAEVPRVLGAVSDLELARQIGMSTEIRWKTYLDAVAAVLPTDVSISQFSLVGPAPTDALVMATDPLQAASIGSISFQGRTKTVPDTAAWIDALASVPGFGDPWVSSATVSEEDGTVFYTVASTVRLMPLTFANRFTETEGSN